MKSKLVLVETKKYQKKVERGKYDKKVSITELSHTHVSPFLLSLLSLGIHIPEFSPLL